jgi:site-specific DNA-methyltransferase (adenine-specific)
MIRTYTNEGDTVLDFTAGSMSVAVAAYLEGRNSVCIEMDTEQYNKSVEWVKNCSFDNPYNISD